MKAAPQMECCCSAAAEADTDADADAAGEVVAGLELTGADADSRGGKRGGAAHSLEAQGCCQMSSSTHGGGFPVPPERIPGSTASLEAPSAVFHEVVSLVSLERIEREAALRPVSAPDTLLMLPPAIPALAQSCILVI